VTAGLTQEALADRAGISLRGVSDLERGLRRLPYPDTVERLIAALGLDSAEQAALQAARRTDGGVSRPPNSGLPAPLTSFVGRETELDAVARSLAKGRLVTLIGAGGIGKTRLAIEAAQQHGATFAQRVHLVSLAGVGSAGHLASAIAAALGFRFHGPTPADAQLINYLRDKHLLLVLDNFEHLLDGAGLLTEILSLAPRVWIMVTSRERLNLQEEWALSIEGLPFPKRHGTEPIEQYASVQLFVQRARQVQVDFSLADHALAVTEVCRLVEGLPLALELAATWLRVMPCEQIAVQLERSVDFLTTSMRNVPDRHRSLRAVFDRSWRLLSDVDQRAVASLSVFRGGFDMDAAEQVGGASLGLLASLVDKSLVRPTPAGRYDLHELVRQYLSRKLLECGDASAVTTRHFDFYSRLADRAEAQLYGPDQEAWFDRLEVDYDNFAAALAWSISDRHAEAGLRLAAALGAFWEHRGHHHDGDDWFRKLLAIESAPPASVRAQALWRAGVFADYVGEPDKARTLCEAGLTLARSAGDRWNIAWSLAALGFFWRTTPDLGHEVALLKEALALFRALEDGWGMSHALRRLGWLASMQGDYERAAMLFQEALSRARHVDNKHAIAWSLLLLANVIWLHSKDTERTLPLLQESLALVDETRDWHNLEYGLVMRGQVAAARGDYDQAQSDYDAIAALVDQNGGIDYKNLDLIVPVVLGYAQLAMARRKPEHAARLFGAAHMVLSKRGVILIDRVGIDHDIAEAREQLGESAFAAAFRAGQGMGMEQAIAYALDGRVASPPVGW